MAEIYRTFADDWKHILDFSNDMLLELYNYESYGGCVSPLNGFAVGKKYLNLHVTGWKEEIAQGLLFKHELYEDPKFPHWWLDSVLKGVENNYRVWLTMRDKGTK
jgi:hypothetical protein